VARESLRWRQRHLPLLRVIWPFVAVVVLLALLGNASLHVMSSVRAYVGAESLWSKAQKAAVGSLIEYAHTRDVADYRRYVSAIAVTLGDRRARIELEKPDPDLNVAREGFLAGGNHLDDIEGMIDLFRRFRNVNFMAKAIAIWTDGDEHIAKLEQVAAQMHAAIAAGGDAMTLRPQLSQVRDLDAWLTPIEKEFSATLGVASRQVANLLTFANIVVALALVLLALVHTMRLVRQREVVETALLSEQDRAQVTLAAIADAVITVDTQSRIEYLNPVAERLTGWSSEDAEGRPLHEVLMLQNESTGKPVDDAVSRMLSEGSAVESDGHIVLSRRDGTEIAIDRSVAPIRNRRGKIVGAVLVFQDKSREREYVSRLSHLASHDALTGLINRREFEVRLQRVLTAAREDHGHHAVLYLDLDQFKVVNDTCGHAAGDELLRQVAVMLRPRLREGDALARLGGDEFGVLLEHCPPEPALRIAEALRKAIADLHFTWQRRSFRIGVSIGLVNVDGGPATLANILSAADAACYMAKEKGRDRVQVYRAGDREVAQRHGEMEWVNRIHRAIADGRLALYAQPIHDIRAGAAAPRSVELLLRLLDDNNVIVPPMAFIPAAERYNLMPTIDRWVIETAFGILAQQRLDPGAAPLHSCAINLSGASLSDEFLDFLRTQFTRFAVPYSLICFEITETTAVTSLSKASDFISALRRLGCRFALDDFGVGMSSFTYLKHLPVDFLKIDGSFVRSMLDDPVDRALVETIHKIGHVLGMQTVAEAVESDAVLEALRAIGVEYAQGYGIAEPEPFAASNVRHVAFGARR
jgi:diguanylate cyclase (GGDEF)-like protein/PAS domain S-box-containing protein